MISLIAAFLSGSTLVWDILSSFLLLVILIILQGSNQLLHVKSYHQNMILIVPLPNCCHFCLFCSLYSAHNLYRWSISVFKQTSINVPQKSPLRLETVLLKLGCSFNALMARVIGGARRSEWPLKIFRLNNIWTPKYVCYKEEKKKKSQVGEIGHRGRKAWCLFKEFWVFLFCWESLCLWVHFDIIWLPSNVKLPFFTQNFLKNSQVHAVSKALCIAKGTDPWLPCPPS